MSEAALSDSNEVGSDGRAEDSNRTEVRICGACGEAVSAEAKWCEACGADLSTPPPPAASAVPSAPAGPAEPTDSEAVTGSDDGADLGGPEAVGTGETAEAEESADVTKPLARPDCVSCGAAATDIAEDGYCGVCGYRQPGERDHLETDLGIVASVSNKGKRHHHNEDSYALKTRDCFMVVAVCDGVSTTEHSETVSQLAADTAAETLLGLLVDDNSVSGEAHNIDAIAKAQAAVEVLPEAATAAASPPSTTLALASLRFPEPLQADDQGRVASPVLGEDSEVSLTVGWMGDSRVYWDPDDGPIEQLTIDHSWANDAVRAGLVSRSEAEVDPRARSITRWIGIDAPDAMPEVVSKTLSSPGRLIVCSDGLYNYADPPELLDETISSHVEFAASPIALSRSLVAFANDSGGQDNITVVIVDLRFDTAPRMHQPESLSEPSITAEDH